ncbi:DEAD/DEAH box helicase [Salmonella enterica subsp. enterica serovar Oranienburg]|nr:DEAD/DEAH box helicase [Salmonella enterica subsp. enterica serovar Oranienburg]
MLNITPNFAQERGLNLLRRKWKQKRTFMMYAPTGSGKTGLAAFIAAGHVARGLRVMFVAPFTVLVTQTVQRFVEYGLPEDEISILWRDHPEFHPERLIQIASADTLIRRDFPDNIDLLIIDEAHMKKRAMLEWIRDAEFRVVGLSGTPFSPWLGQYYEELIKPTTISELIQRGDLSPYEFYAPTKPNLKGVKTANTADYGRDLPTVAFCVNKAHANYVTMQFVKAGVNAEVMVAETPHEERQVMIHRFETGATKIIVSVGVLVAGFDSDVRCVIYARPTKSEIRWLQCLGRALRTAPGKDKALIFDHSGTVHRLGFPDAIEYNELPSKNDGMKEAATRQAEEREEKLPKECPECHFMKPAGVYVCPKCGFKPLVGEDVVTDTQRNIKKLSKGGKVYTKSDKQSWWSQIKFYQRQRTSMGRPISDGWCAHTFREKFNEWPNNLSDFPMEITPEVSNYIRHKLIRFAKGKGKAGVSAETASPIPDSDTTYKVISAKRQVEKIRSMPGRKTA